MVRLAVQSDSRCTAPKRSLVAILSVIVLLALGALGACTQSGSSVDCEKQLRFNNVVYSSHNVEVTGLERPVGTAIEPTDAVAVVFRTDTKTKQALLYVPGTEGCDISPELLKRIQLTGPQLCSSA